MNESRYRVAESWSHDNPDRGASMHTDGHTIYSYNHVVGVTVDGTKIAYDCHYSTTTTKQCSAVKRYATAIASGCPSCRATHAIAPLTVAATDPHAPPQWTLSDVQLLSAQNS